MVKVCEVAGDESPIPARLGAWRDGKKTGWLSARSRYPLSCAVLMRERLIESDEKFRERKDKEMKEEMQKALQNLNK